MKSESFENLCLNSRLRCFSIGVNNENRDLIDLLPQLKRGQHFRIDRSKGQYRPIDLGRVRISPNKREMDQKCQKMAQFVQREKDNPLFAHLIRNYGE